ncbi:MAG TPA: peptidase M48, partial [Flavobacterium sp.]|nr:peptidase M48 [Flavobacterium sp.]
LAQMNLVSNLTDMENYGYAIYVCLLNIQNQIEVEHHKYWLGKNFELVHEARKNYSLNRYLDRINPKNQSESYQQFLNFMWNLNLNEFSKIATYYKKETKN